MTLNPQLLCRQIDKTKQNKKKPNKTTGKMNCSYKNSRFSELVYDSSVFVLMDYSCKDVLKDLDLGLVGTFSFEGLLYFVYSFG